MDDQELTNYLSKRTARKRKTINMEQKMNIINKFEKGEKLTLIAKEFGLASSTVKTILKDRERIKSHVSTITSLKSTIITKKRAGAISEMEKLLTLWIKDQMEKNVLLSLGMIQAKARSIFEDVKVKLGDTNTKFVASNGWFHKFKSRASIPNVELSGDVINEQMKNAKSYPSVLKNIIEEGYYTMHQIYNVGQTELFWKKIPRNTHFFQGMLPDDRVTVLLGCNASGDHKLKPFLLIHSELLPEQNKVIKTDVSLHYRFVSDAQMTTELFEDWFLSCFIPDVEKYCAEKNTPARILLILNNTLQYLTHLNNFRPNIKVVFLPPRSTAILEPVNLGLISAFRHFYLRQVLEQAADGTEKYQNLGNFLNSFQISDAIQNIDKAWGLVDGICMNTAWRKLCPQFVDYSVESNEYCKIIMNEIMKLSERLGLEFRAADIDEFLNPFDAKHLKSKRVRRNTSEESEFLEREFDIMEMTTAFREITSAMARFQKMDPDSSRFEKVKNGVERTLECYRRILEEKRGKTSEQLSFVDCTGEIDNNLTPGTSQQHSSYAGQDAPLIVSVDPDDVMLISSSSECSDAN